MYGSEDLCEGVGSILINRTSGLRSLNLWSYSEISRNGRLVLSYDTILQAAYISNLS